MAKQNKQSIEFALRDLLAKGKAGTHEDICTALDQQGYSVNQPKISRLLHKLGAVKVSDQHGNHTYRLPHEHGLMHELNITQNKPSALPWLLDINHNGNLIVVHTTPGAAALVAREIDLYRGELDILGSIAGDDTIFVAPKDIKHIKEATEQMRSKFVV